MNFINSLNDKYFTINGVQYFRNYVSAVHGDKIELYNCYERKDVLIPLTGFSNFTVNGSVYLSAEELQAELLGVTYSRLTIGDNSSIDQNNETRVISVGTIVVPESGYLPLPLTTTIANKLNETAITITAKQTPVIITAKLQSVPGIVKYTSKLLKYLFKPGKGNWGLDGTPITPAHFELISTENYLVQDLLSEPNAVIENLGSVPDGDFITVANERLWDFADSDAPTEVGIKTYYFSYETDGVLYFAQFIGAPGIYGDMSSKKFTINDFTSSTDTRVTEVPNLEQVLAEGGNINVSQLTNNGNGTSPYTTEASLNGLSISVNQAAAEMYFKNKEGITLSTINLGFLNNEGTTFYYDEISQKLQLKNDSDEILSEIPVNAFVSNLMQSVEFNGALPSKLEFKDASGYVVDSVEITINNVTALQAALNEKAPLVSPSFSGTPTAPTAAAGTNTTQVATTQFVQTAVSNKITNGGDMGIVTIGTTNNSNVSFIRNNTNSFILTTDGINLDVSTAPKAIYGLSTNHSIYFQNQGFINYLASPAVGISSHVIRRMNTTTGDIVTFYSGVGGSNLVAGIRSDGTAYGANAVANNDFVTLSQLKSGTSGVIAQTINDGITTSAPSQDAIFDALALKANDNNVIHLSGNEGTITGQKTFINSTANFSLQLTNSNAGGAIGITNTGSAGISIGNNPGGSTGISINNSSTTTNSNAINIVNTQNDGIFFNTSGNTSNSIRGLLTGTAKGLVFSNTGGGFTGQYINFQTSGQNPFIVDYLANVNANSFIKSGGTSSQFLKADGSIDATSYATNTNLNLKLNSALTNGSIFIGNASNVATEQTVTGDVTISNTGVTSISGTGTGIVYARQNSPTFTGTPFAPTPALGDNSTKIATTAFVQAASDAKVQNSLTSSITLAPSATAVNSALATKADDSLTLHKALPETITGLKTVQVNGEAFKLQKTVSTGNSFLRFYDETNTQRAYIGIFNTTNDLLIDNPSLITRITGSPILLNPTSGNVVVKSSADTGEDLQVTGKVRISATVGDAALKITRGGNEGMEFIVPSGGTGLFVMQNYDRTALAYKPITIAASKMTTVQGNVILDTSNNNPTDTGEKLQVNGNERINGQLTVNTSTIPAGNIQMQSYWSASGTGGYSGYFATERSGLAVIGSITNTQNGDILFKVDKSTIPLTGASPTRIFNVLGNGNTVFGNNTIDSGETVQINGTAKITTNLKTPRLEFPFDPAQTVSRAWAQRNDYSVKGDFVIGTFTDQANATFLPRIYIKPTGEVGINSSNPTKTHYVAGTGEYTGQLTIPDGTGAKSAVTLDQLNARILSVTANLDFPNIAGGTYQELTVNVTGAEVGDNVVVSLVNNSFPPGLLIQGFIIATGVVTVRATMVITTYNTNLPPMDFKIRIIK